MPATQTELTEWRLLFTDKDGENPKLGDIVYYNRHGAIAGKAMRRRHDRFGGHIRVVKVRIEVIEEIE